MEERWIGWLYIDMEKRNNFYFSVVSDLVYMPPTFPRSTANRTTSFWGMRVRSPPCILRQSNSMYNYVFASPTGIA